MTGKDNSNYFSDYMPDVAQEKEEYIVMEAKINIKTFAAILRFFDMQGERVHSRCEAISNAVEWFAAQIDNMGEYVEPTSNEEARMFIQRYFPKANLLSRRLGVREKSRQSNIEIISDMGLSYVKERRTKGAKGKLEIDYDNLLAIVNNSRREAGEALLTMEEYIKMLNKEPTINAKFKGEETEDTSGDITVVREPDTYDKNMFASIKIDDTDYVQK